MRRSVPLLIAVLMGSACQSPGRVARTLEPLGEQGELYVYVEPLPGDASRVAFTIESVAAVGSDAAPPTALEIILPEVRGSERRQRLVAWGRVPPGDYTALLVKFKRATLQGDEVADLAVGAEPFRIPAPVVVGRGRASLLSVTLKPGTAVGPSYQFTPSFTAAVPSTGIVPVTGYCTSTEMAAVTVFDRHAHRAIGVFPVGREPAGIALDIPRNRAYVALSGDDQVQAVDLITGNDVGRVQLRNGDGPRELVLTPDGTQLIIANERSSTVSFVDVSSLIEVGRVQTVLSPTALLLDRSGRRAYALSGRSNAISVIDVTYRAVSGTIGTEALPLRAQLSRAGDRIYVALAGSPYVSIYGVPDLALKSRIFVGLGATTLKVDPRTDLLYVGGRDDTRLQVFDPISPMPVNSLDLPAGTSWLTIDDLENALVALLPGRHSVAYLDLASRRVVGEVECAFDPYQVTVVGER